MHLFSWTKIQRSLKTPFYGQAAWVQVFQFGEGEITFPPVLYHIVLCTNNLHLLPINYMQNMRKKQTLLFSTFFFSPFWNSFQTSRMIFNLLELHFVKVNFRFMWFWAAVKHWCPCLPCARFLYILLADTNKTFFFFLMPKVQMGSLKG